MPKNVSNFSRFLYVEVGHHGSDSDGGVFGQSKLHDIILSKNEGFPPYAPLGNIGQIPFYLVGDEAFPLKTYLMRPYPRKSLQPFFATSAEEEASQGERQDSEPVSFEEAHSKRIFNYRLSRARRVVENAFGIMAQRWRILRRPFKAKDYNIRRIIFACVVLHNFMMKESETSRYAYCPPGTADHVDWQGNITEGSWWRTTTAVTRCHLCQRLAAMPQGSLTKCGTSLRSTSSPLARCLGKSARSWTRACAVVLHRAATQLSLTARPRQRQHSVVLQLALLCDTCAAARCWPRIIHT